MKNLNLLLTTLIAVTMLSTACTKKREASLPEAEETQIFSLSDFGPMDSSSGFSLKTAGDANALSAGEAGKAINEKGRVNVDLQSLKVPTRLQFMFRGFEVAGAPGEELKVVFSVDNGKFVTAYKVADNPAQLSTLEKARAISEARVKSAFALSRTRDAGQIAKLKKQIEQADVETQKVIAAGKSERLLVPLFKYKIDAMGIVQRTKNDNGDETANLALKATEWTLATHVKISDNSANRLPIEKKEELDRVFMAKSIDQKVLSVEDLRKQFGIAVNLPDDAKVLLQVSSESIDIYLVSSAAKAGLSEGERAMLASGRGDDTIRTCSAEAKRFLPVEEQKDCVAALRFTYKITHIVPELKKADEEGTTSNELNLRTVRARDGIGLIKIADDGIPTAVTDQGVIYRMDPRYIVHKSEVLGKEFYYRRTFESAGATSGMSPGMSGDTLLVKFELQENRLVVKKTVQVVDFRNDNDVKQEEEVMSFPVNYYREQKVDDAGNALGKSRFEKVNMERAEYIQFSWAMNTVPNFDSPLNWYIGGGCLKSVNNVEVAGLDQRLAKDGVLNFSLGYSMTLNPLPRCVAPFMGEDDYSLDATNTRATTQNVRERFSFVVNDKSMDETFAPQVPYRAQKTLGYGVWSSGRKNPTDNGNTGLEGQQIDRSGVIDFRNNKTLVYTLGGLPQNEGRVITVTNPDGSTESIDLKELYTEMSREVVDDWNVALKRAFKGTELDKNRTAPYISLQINGENGVNGRLGDLDKNFMWYEDVYHPSGIGVLFGVSQPASNVRSGATFANNVIMYSGNIRWYTELSRRNAFLIHQYNKSVEEAKAAARKQLAEEDLAGRRSGEIQKSSPDQTELGQGVQQKLEKQIGVVKSLIAQTQVGNEFDRGAGLKTLPASRIQASRPQLQGLIREIRQAIGLKPSTGGEMSLLERTGVPKAYIHSIMNKIHSIESSLEDTDLEILTINEVLSVLGKQGRLSEADRRALTMKAAVLEHRKKLIDYSKTRPGCFDISRESMTAGFATASFRESLKISMKQTLVHEIGHSLGLTHNFIASFDKENFQFEGVENDPERIASSVMDYMEDKFRVYGGPGPYDVHALRASYTGRLQGEDGDVHVDDIKKQLGGKWTNLTPFVASQLPIKKYKYCNDMDAGYEPVCERHDFGSTAQEIVENIIKDYHDSYITTRHGYERLTFGWLQKFRAVTIAINSMLSARMFMDEFIYKAVTGGSAEEQQDHALAAFAAYKFLLQVIGSPDASNTLFQDTEARHALFPYTFREVVRDEDGEPIPGADGKPQFVEKTDVEMIQRKSLYDLAVARDRFDTIGTEDDKIIAMEVLTMKGYPHWKYRQASLTLSYLDFERYVLGVQNPSQSAIMNTLLSLLKDDLRPHMTNDKVFFAPLPADFKTEVTQSMRLLAGINAIIGLEAMALRDKDNFANLFKTGSALGNGPADRPSLGQLDADRASTQRMSYFALDGATISQALVKEGQRHYFYAKNDAVLKNALKALLGAVLKRTAAAKGTDEEKAAADKGLADVKAAIVKSLTDAGVNNTAILLAANNEALAKGNVAENVINVMERLFAQAYADGNAIELYMNFAALRMQMQFFGPEIANSPEARALLAKADQLKAANAQIAELLPMAAVAQAVMRAAAEESAQAKIEGETAEQTKQRQGRARMVVAGMTELTAEADFEGKYNTLLNSLNFMALLTRIVSPEFTR